MCVCAVSPSGPRAGGFPATHPPGPRLGGRVRAECGGAGDGRGAGFSEEPASQERVCVFWTVRENG